MQPARKLCPQCSDALSRRFQQAQVQIRDGDWRTPSRFETERASQSVWSMGHLGTSRTAWPFCQYLFAVTECNPALSGRELDDDEQLLLVPYKAGITHFESTTSQIMWRWRIGARTRDAPVAWPMGSVYPLIEGQPKVTDPEGERMFHGRNTGPLIGWETVRRWHAWCVEHHTRAYPHTFATEPEQFLTCDHVSQPSDMTSVSSVSSTCTGTALCRYPLSQDMSRNIVIARRQDFDKIRDIEVWNKMPW
jgi:hypothetical protein